MQTRLHTIGTCVAAATKAVIPHIRAGIIWINRSQPMFTEAPWGWYIK